VKLSPAVFAPEGGEGDIEERDLVVAMNEQRAAGVINVAAVPVLH